LADDIILETRGLTKEFKGFGRRQGRQPQVCGRQHSCLDRPQWRRQDHLLQPADALPGADLGTHLLQGARYHRLPSGAHCAHGLVRSFQISAVFPHLTVLENVRVALHGKRGHSFDFWRSARVLDELNAGARELIAAVGLSEFEPASPSSCLTRASARSRSATTLALDPR